MGGSLRTVQGTSPPRLLSHIRTMLLLLFLGTYTQGQGPGTADTTAQMSVVEEQPPGVVAGWLPVRAGYNYTIREPSSLFALYPGGVIRTLVRIDREALPRDSISLFVGGSHPQLAFHPIDVTISILDINDNSPQFEEATDAVSFQEDAAAGQQQLIVTATDPDKGNNGTIAEYQIVSGNSEGKFQLIPPSPETPFMYIMTEGRLDRETKDFYQLNISARDNGDVPRYGYLQLSITITDVNDEPPTFNPSNYMAEIKERADVGTAVIRVEATDGDTGDNALVLYSMSDPSGQFMVDEQTGVVKTVTSPLQCNRVCGPSTAQCTPYSCLLTVIARDRGHVPLEGRAYITVAIIDENDHDPIITIYPAAPDPATGYATVDENASELRPVQVARISVTDADRGVNGETSVEIVRGNEEGHFQHISIVSPVKFNYIQVVGSLDRETTAQYNLTLKAVDHGSPPRSSTAYLIIIVNDANDHAPVFQKSEYEASISELAKPESYVASIKAVDEDSGPNSQLMYSIVSGNELGWFKVDSSTGLITTKATLDYELVAQVVLNISAADNGAIPFRNYTKLTVSVLDENDVAPRFKQSEWNLDQNENQPPPQTLAALAADDQDSGINGTVTYYLHPDTQLLYPNTFRVDRNSGVVSTLMALDHEFISNYLIKVVAQDGGTPAMSSTATLYLRVNDLNDNKPQFEPDLYYVNVFETDPSGIPVVQVSAVDLDSGSFGRLRYSITVNTTSFKIDAGTGLISSATKLIRSVQSSYRLTVTATDGGGSSSPSPAVVNVIVADINDVGPIFSQQTYTFSVIEDNGLQASNLGDPVGQVQATGGGGSLTYAITDGDPFQVFTIDSSGFIRKNKLIDHEVQAQYLLTVIATTGSKFGKQKVTINVQDMNDNSPQFTATTLETVVMENWPVGNNIFLAGAVDADSGLNSKLEYTLRSAQDTTGIFGIDQHSGIISLRKPTSQLTRNQVTLTVVVKDSGVPQRTASIDITVKMQDVNDHTPVFPRNVYSIPVLESKEENEIIMKFVATDVDQGRNGELVYSIIRGNENKRFGIFPDGTLYVAHALDRETRDMYSLTIQVRDCGDVPRSSVANVTVYVLDANDNSPAFANATYVFWVAENRPAGVLVGKVQAADNDIGQNAELTYSLTDGNNNFSIDYVTGAVYTKRSFDREYVMDTSSVEFYNFEVVAADGGTPKLRGRSTIKVYVTDVNDNPPVFARSVFNTVVSENAAKDYNVIKMTATDADAGANAVLTYSITAGNQAGKFKVKEGTGDVVVVGPLDRETRDRYRLTVVATDSGIPPLSATAEVSILVLDYNDNVPAITSTVRQISVNEMTALGELLTTFAGSDLDIGNNAKMFFSIYSGNDDGVFNLDGYTGKMYLARYLDYETKQQYLLNISVTDAGYPSLSSYIFFTVRVVDANDNAPEFVDGFKTINVREDTRNEPIATLSAVDRDSGEFGRVQFAIISQDPAGQAFSIDATSGKIRVAGELDREATSYYRLVITATDQAVPRSLCHTTQKSLNINILDVNDNAPVFKSPPAYVIPSSARVGQIVAEVFADDADTGDNAGVTYSLPSGSQLFALHQDTGQLSLLRLLPDNPYFYTLRVMARDKGSEVQRTTETNITIILSKTTETGPVFDQTTYTGSLSEASAAGTSVFRVAAPGTREDVTVEYYLTGIMSAGIPRGAIFSVHPTTGVVTNTMKLDRETLGETLTLNITAAEQGGGSPRTRTTEAKVTLRDVNDTPPRFSPSVYSQQYPENQRFDPSVVRVIVSDPDTTPAQLRLQLFGNGSSDFDIQSDGTIVVAIKQLDREAQSLYMLTVTASDTVFTSTASVTITVTDVNDNNPVFTQAFYSFEVPENADTGATVARVTALDPDEGDNALVSYEVLSRWGTDVFQLESVLGTFTLIGGLDYETRQLYALNVSARDGGSPPLSGVTVVYMNVADVNDNQPEFDPASYSQEVWENVSVGYTVINVSATDIDAGRNGEVRYSLIGDSNLYFMIDLVTGTIQTAAPLDREVQSSFSLDVMATDQAEKPEDRLSTVTVVNVVLKDVNDWAPQFVSDNVTSVKEETPPGTVVFTVSATDKDAGVNSEVTYRLVTAGSPFVLNSTTGDLVVSSTLRREAAANYSLLIVASDRGAPPLSSSQTLTVTIKDVNNNPPAFSQGVYETMVPEDIAVGTSLLRVVATDLDEGLNGVVRYFVTAGDDGYDLVLDGASGVLRVQKSLDYERLTNYTLTVVAEDSGVEETLTSTATVRIRVTDVNDFQPLFDDSPYVAYVQEEVADVPVEVTSVRARDEDADRNGLVSYQLRDTGNGLSDIFRIHQQSGLITALRALDREQVSVYILTVVAVDGGNPYQLTGTGTVTVYVKDVNDHTPMFASASPYIGNVVENGNAGQPVTTITATDMDEGINAQILYRLEDSYSDIFTIMPNTGQILATQPLDREQQAEYHLVVIATDQGIPMMSSSCSVIVYVDDVNDNAPEFELASYTRNILDPTNPGDFVIGVTAVDSDSGNNGKVVYSLSDPENRFIISPETGVVTAAQRLSGAGKTYSFQVRASDLGLTPQNQTVSVTIRSQQVSGSPPAFGDFPQNIRIQENSAKNTLVTTVSAVTSRSSRVSYYIAGGNVNSALAINESNGTITVVGLVDYEVATSVTLWLEARDMATPSLSTYKQLLIAVEDVNDNRPRFRKGLYETSLMENKPMGSYVIQVEASDADSGMNGQIVFRIASGNENNTFGINSSSGNITTRNPVVDREGIELYYLVIEAVDQGNPQRTATATAKITILDQNDNRPVFSVLFSVAVPEDVPLNSVIMTVTSTDRDTPPNANVTYQFLPDSESSPFAIDPLSGVITNIRTLDAETNERYRPAVRAYDSVFATQTQMTIRLLDVNDNAPQFGSPLSFDFREGQPRGTPIGRLVASDLDISSPNNDFYFSLKRPSTLFDLDAESGQITALTSMEFIQAEDGQASMNIYTLEVLVTDLGIPSLSSQAVVTISITDANNHAPIFEQSYYMSAVPENAAVRTSVLQVQAHDYLDVGLNAEVKYSISSGNGSSFFDINEGTGIVFVTQSIQGFRGRYYSVIITATDKGNPPQSSVTTVVLSVTDINRYTPVFQNNSFQSSLLEDVPMGSVVTMFSATDQDSGLNGQVRYRVTSGNEAGLFSLDAVTGQLTVAGPLDYETEHAYVLNITASDLGLLSRSASRLYTVALLDVNDNDPTFNQSVYYAFVSENAPLGTIILTVSADDRDSGNNSIVKYALSADVAAGRDFIIDENRGLISTTGNLDYETRSFYSLSVTAYNPTRGNSTLRKSVAQVRVYVTGINEYPPRFAQKYYSISVSESVEMNATLLTLIAADQDKGVDGIIYYYLVGSSNLQGFALGPLTGALKVVGRPDYESSPNIILTALVKNWGSIVGNDTDTCTISITVKDANDPPVFTEQVYVANIPEGSSAGTLVTTVSAIDNDFQEENRQFYYKIDSGNDGGWFNVDASTGQIRTTGHGQLDRETVPDYQLTVVAIDRGIPSQTGTCTVKIHLDDKNDNAPVFSPPNLTAHVVEGRLAGELVINLADNTTDMDLPPNRGPYTYQAIPGIASNYFNISQYGPVRTKVVLSREEKQEFNISVIVYDNGQPQMSSTLTFRVVVMDINNTPPQERPLTVWLMLPQSMSAVGIIADIQPLDMDVEGNYQCSIERGAVSLFVITRGCNLSITAEPDKTSYTLNVSGSDGAFPRVYYPVTVNIRRYSQSMLDNSVAVLLDRISASEFLNKYDTFVKAVRDEFGSSSSPLVLSLKEDQLDLFVFLAVENNGVSVTQSELTRRLRSAKSMIESKVPALKMKVVPYLLCSANPCQNGGTCATQVLMTAGFYVQNSDYSILTSATPGLDEMCLCPPSFGGNRCMTAQEKCGQSYCANGGTCQGTSCRCRPEWSGTYCETDVNECLSRPCQSGGTCVNTPGSFRCNCSPGFSGELCEIIIHCFSEPCWNGATCVDTPDDYVCNCTYGYYGKECNKSSIGFNEGSFLTLSAITEYSKLSVVLMFATVSENALLLFNPVIINGVPSSRGYLALEIDAGYPRFSFNLEGPGAVPVELSVPYYVNTGHWYRMEVNKQPEMASLVVQRCNTGGTECEPCEGQVASCSNTVTFQPQTSGIQGLNLSIGGINDFSLITNLLGAVRSHDFVGCAYSFSVNDRDVLNKMAAIDYTRLSDTCPRQEEKSLCAAGSCANGGQCVDLWTHLECLCPSQTSGLHCEAKLQPFGFGPNAKVTFKMKQSYRRDQLLQQSLSGRRRRSTASTSDLLLRVRTKERDGVLFYSNTADSELVLWIEGGILKVVVNPVGVVNPPLSLQADLANTEWHNISLTTVGSVTYLEVQGDLRKSQDFHTGFDFASLDIQTMVIGGSRTVPTDQVIKGFEGCLSEFLINGEKLPIMGSSERYDITITSDVATSCLALCDDDPCPVGEKCQPDGESFNCSAVVATTALAPASKLAGLEPGIIVVIVFFIVLLIIIIIVFIVFRLRRSWFHRCLPVKGDKSNTTLKGSENTLPSSRDSRYAENSQLSEQMIIQNHIAEELAGQKASALTARPDLIGSNLSGMPQPTHFADGTVIIENVDNHDVTHLVGLNADEMPEHYDLENASSIAPSDSDVIQHYQRFRHNDLKPRLHSSHHNYHNRFHDSNAAFRENAHQRQSPISLNGSALSMPARNSPLVVAGQGGRPSSALAALRGNYAPRDSPRTTDSPLNNTHSRGSRSNSAHSLGSHHSHSSSSSNPQPASGHISFAGRKGGKGQSVYMRGLTVDEVNRLNARADIKNTASMLEAVSSSSDDPQHKRLHNAHAQRMRPEDPMESSILLEPPDSSDSDSGANDSFTCSEFEYENDRGGRLDPGTIIFSKLAEVDEGDSGPNNFTGPMEDGLNSNGDSVGSTGASDSTNSQPGANPLHPSNGSFDFDSLLNWGPNFDKLVGVFKDIALLPDSSQAHVEGATSNDYEEYV